MLKTATLTLCFLLATTLLTAQTATVKGVLKTNSKIPIEGVAITFLNTGTTSDEKGEYVLKIPANTEITITFSHISYNTFEKIVKLQKNKILQFSPVLEPKIEIINEVIVKDIKKDAQGLIIVNPSDIAKIPGANQGVENILMTLPGVNNNNELSTQYNVRGGNFDENLVYV
ncbi:MAG: carboxypeptidase-like regulatory domain-containing protein, partial [Lutibacter sp.]|nr:carboxypeptidase-like regulatory domain-containing protein [Lutibacter sp.]